MRSLRTVGSAGGSLRSTDAEPVRSYSRWAGWRPRGAGRRHPIPLRPPALFPGVALRVTRLGRMCQGHVSHPQQAQLTRPGPVCHGLYKRRGPKAGVALTPGSQYCHASFEVPSPLGRVWIGCGKFRCPWGQWQTDRGEAIFLPWVRTTVTLPEPAQPTRPTEMPPAW